jgi:hypothetical protein
LRRSTGGGFPAEEVREIFRHSQDLVSFRVADFAFEMPFDERVSDRRKAFLSLLNTALDSARLPHRLFVLPSLRSQWPIVVTTPVSYELALANGAIPSFEKS